MQFVSGEQDTTPVDPSKPKDPGSAMSREDRGFSLWDEEQHRTTIYAFGVAERIVSATSSFLYAFDGEMKKNGILSGNVVESLYLCNQTISLAAKWN